MLILYLSLREGQTYNVVIIAKRIHLFPYRTQKLSSLALMVLGGQPPGRVRRSHVVFFYYLEHSSDFGINFNDKNDIFNVSVIYSLNELNDL